MNATADTATETFIRESFLRVAHAQKKWAAGVSDEWKANACEMSRRMQQDYLTQPAEQLAEKARSYLEHRASLTYGLDKRPIDPADKRIWEALKRHDAAPLFKHYECYLTP